MKNNENLSKLEEIKALGEFSSLSSFSDPKKWKEMTRNERELLGTLFVMQGNQLALQKSQEATKCFKMAAKAAPSSPNVFYKIGEAYVGMGEDVKSLKAACKSFAKAVDLNPEFYEAWAAYALTETRFGEVNKDISNFIQADSKYQKAYELLIRSKEPNPGLLCWKWGGLWYRIAKMSGEPSDFHIAIQKFRLAKESAVDDPSFLNDFGNLLAEQAILIGSHDLFEKAANEYQECIVRSPRHAQAYLNLGCACMRLFEATGDIAYFQKGEEAFRASSDIDPHQSALWLFWGVLELAYAKRMTMEKDRGERFLSAIKRFEVADLCEPLNAVILLKWAEALLFMGSHEENCTHLKEALEKIKKSLELDSERGETWYFYGRILIELGRYFQDERVFLEAQEKFRYGLTVEPQFVAFHYGIAETCMELAEITDDIEYFEESQRHFKKVAQSNIALSPQFWLDFGIVYFRLGEARKEMKDIETAMALFEKALTFFDGKRSTPLALDIIFHYATAKSIIGDLTDDPQAIEKAARLFAEILHEDPHFESVRLQYALCLQHLGEMVADVEILRESINQYEVVIRVDPEDDLAWNGVGVSLISLAEMLNDPMHSGEATELRNKAELNLLHAASLGCDESFYSLACLFSLAGNMPESLYFLEKARSKGALPPLEDMMNDDWLEDVRATEEFRAFMSEFSPEEDDEGEIYPELN